MQILIKRKNHEILRPSVDTIFNGSILTEFRSDSYFVSNNVLLITNINSLLLVYPTFPIFFIWGFMWI